MPTLLQLDSSADLTRSRSRALTAAFAEAWAGASPDNTVVHRDLHRDQLPHLADPEQHWATSLRLPGADIPDSAAQIQQAVLDDLFAADALVIGVPTYNYTMPSTLKAWLDCIHVPGVTTATDGVGPLVDRPVVLISSSGATYDPGTPTAGWNHAIPPLQIVLGDSLGMLVQVITCTRTLADRVPEMAAERERADAEFLAARDQASALGVDLGSRTGA